ncbi:NUDIX domain-containing protein, partial [Candidatus Azambacteria bacterium]|nr:NUDIX domain-containing protein [Candidatus Azambacteria bacterium]
ESDIEAAKREFEEETGISEYEIPDEKNFFIEEYFFKKENDIVYKTVKYFIAFTKNKNVNMQMSEVADFKWLPYEEAVSQLTFHEGKDIAKKANEFLKQLSLIL